MKIKEAKTCGAFAWSPAADHKGYIAIGSIAGAMADDFSADAHLEIRSVDIWDTKGTDMPVVGRVSIPDRVHRIDWSAHSGGHGILAGGFVDGMVSVWSASKIIAGGVEDKTYEDGDAANPLLCRINAHQGAVKGCQFNLLDAHFLATAGADKEMHIYSLEKPESPQEVPACNKSTHPSEITDLRWNPKIKHILGTTTSSGVVTVWDLKARRSALNFNVASGGTASAANTLAWHPDVATHIAVARDEPNPVIQMWDLRKAMAPIRELRGHTKGVLALAWCAEDPTVLMSVGADGRTMCWNPVTGDLFGEMPAQDNWVYDVKWAPHYPAVVATASFDSSLSVFAAQDIGATSSQTATGRSAPKWLSRPCGATFGFGGRIAMVDKTGKGIKVIKNPAVEGGVTEKERTFCRDIAANPVNTPHGVEWINARGWSAIGAVAAARVASSKAPLLKALGNDPEAVAEKVEAVPKDPYTLGEDEFSKIVSECIVAGKLVAAIDLCLVAGRYDDAFSIAYVAGDAQMKRVHAEFVARKSGKHRFAKYVGAIASGSYDQLAAEADTLPWKEVLSLFAAFSPQNQFAAHCNALGETLERLGKPEAAVDCFLFSGNVDRVAHLFKESGKYDTQSLVQVMTVLEQTLGRQCTSPAYAEALAAYAETLAFDGEFQSSAAYAQRASQLGCIAAASVANRVHAHLGQKVSLPFEVTPLPESTQVECQMMASQQPQLARPAQADPRQTQPTSLPGTQVARTAGPTGGQQIHADPRTGMPVAAGNAGVAPRGQPVPVAAAPGPSQVGPLPTGGRAPGPGPQPYPQPQSHTQPQPVAGQSTPHPAHGGAHPAQPGPYTQPPVQPVTAYQAPPVTAPPVKTAAPPVTHAPPVGAPPVSQPPVHTAPPVTNPGVAPAPTPAQPRVIPATVVNPTVAATATVARPAGAAAASSAAASKETITEVNTTNVAEIYRPIVAVIVDRVEKITDKRKRDTVEKSAVALLQKLNGNEIAEPLGQLLLQYCGSLGTPASKEAWRVMTERHWDAIQPFHNIKFL